MDKNIVISWFGLKNGPILCNDKNISSNDFKYSGWFESQQNDPEYYKLIQDFQKEYPNGNFDTFGEDIEKFLIDHGFNVLANIYSHDENRRELPETKQLHEAMTPDEVNEFIQKLKAGEVKFKFKKVNGEIREARGTLSQDLIPTKPSEDKVEGARKTHRVPDSVIVYWDLDKEAFRSFKKDNFEGYIN